MKKFLLIIAILPYIMSCQEKFNGKDDQSFKASREKIEKQLDQNEKTNLEKAMRVIALESMRLSFEDPAKYEGKSFNKISLEMIDGLSYSSLVNLAEDILKDRNTKEIVKLTTALDSLKLVKNEYVATQKTLNLFKLNSLKLSKEEFFNELVPKLEIDFQYIGKKNLVGPVTIGIELIKKSNNEVIKSEIIVKGDDESTTESGESFTETLALSFTKTTNPKLWNAPKYPILNPNLANFDLVLKIEALSLIIDGKKVALPKVQFNNLDKDIKANQDKIEELKDIKGTLDELELTHK